MCSVGAVSAKERLIRNVVRLRRAERASQVHEDVAAVRADLEGDVGETVGRAMAARLLGVSQTALDRWIASGDVPVVITRTGRREVPRNALLGLMEAVEESRRSGESRNPLAAVLRGRRVDVEGMDIETDQHNRRRYAPRHGHRDAELRGLAYHRAVAGRLDERIVQDARDRLARWRAEGRIDPRYALEWEGILDQPIARVAKLIVKDTPLARDLRQSSPLAGVLSQPERRRVLSLVGEELR